MDGDYPPGSYGARMEELGQAIDAIRAEIKAASKLADLALRLIEAPHNLKRKLQASLPCSIFGHKWEDSPTRVSSRCIRCGLVEMGGPMKKVLQELLGRQP